MKRVPLLPVQPVHRARPGQERQGAEVTRQPKKATRQAQKVQYSTPARLFERSGLLEKSLVTTLHLIDSRITVKCESVKLIVFRVKLAIKVSVGATLVIWI